MNRDQQEGEAGPDHAAHLAAMWAGQSNVIVAVRIRPVRYLIHMVKSQSPLRTLGAEA